jgi:MoxR-like ATPase
MDIKQLKRTLKDLPPKKSVLIKSRHGMGKSQVVAQVAAEMSVSTGKPFGFIDIRLGQYEVGDLIGLPEKRAKYTLVNKLYDKGVLTEERILAENVTVHDLPLWFPREGTSGILFIDEINRGSRDTQQWSFQLILDYRTNFVDVPEGWRVIAACNDNQDEYSVLGMDQALKDRFLEVKFTPTVDEWIGWAKTSGVHDAVLKYIAAHNKDLDPPEKMQSSERYPSRRSWVSLSDMMKYSEANGTDLLKDLEYLQLLAFGYVGNTVALNFIGFIQKEYRVFTPQEILGNFAKVKDEFARMDPLEASHYGEILVDHIKEKGLKLTKSQCENLLEFVKAIRPEVREGFWSDFIGRASEPALAWYNGSPEITKVLNSAFHRPKGK